MWSMWRNVECGDVGCYVMRNVDVCRVIVKLPELMIENGDAFYAEERWMKRSFCVVKESRRPQKASLEQKNVMGPALWMLLKSRKSVSQSDQSDILILVVGLKNISYVSVV